MERIWRMWSVNNSTDKDQEVQYGSVWQYVWQILANTQLLSQLLIIFLGLTMGYYLDTQPPASTPESFDCVRKLRTK